jgi:hypothetical protein
VSDPKLTAGARFEVTRVVDEASGGVVYRGFVHLPEGDRALEVRLDAATGAASAEVEGGDEKLASQAAALVRAATKSALAEGAAPPRKIVRWRG